MGFFGCFDDLEGFVFLVVGERKVGFGCGVCYNLFL